MPLPGCQLTMNLTYNNLKRKLCIFKKEEEVKGKNLRTCEVEKLTNVLNIITMIISLIHKPIDSKEIYVNELRRVSNNTAHNCVVGGWKIKQCIGSVNRRPNNTDCDIYQSRTRAECQSNV